MRLIAAAAGLLLMTCNAMAANGAVPASPAPAATSTAAPARQPDAITPDGGRYHGKLVNGRMHGHGVIEWPTGERYEGGLENGLFAGKGKLQTARFVYEGEFKAGRMSGQGRYAGTDKSVYVGQFADELFHGQGRYENAAKDVYEGSFVKGEFEGKGTYRRADGASHAGMFRDWRPHGPGIYTDAKGNVYEGDFADGDMHGKGRFSGKDGSRYEGEFRDWQYHGQGVFRNAAGDEYKGGFAYGMYDGKGVLNYARPREDGRSRDAGTWRYGALQDPVAAQQIRTNVELALYGQKALLDKTLAGLAPRVPDRINLYLLAIGGDGSQEVFRREVEFVQKQFDRDFGTRGRSLALINSRTTAAQAPMATLTSIRESIGAIAARMDKDRDILFLFLTSHGSKDHQLTLNQNGMDLRDLEAAELGRILKESGIRWKVVVVSACYSGGFIEPLKDAHTMVITAARHDRTSFGCADENDFTYFGKAFFKESLPGAASFADAFRKARTLVEKREADDFRQASRRKPAAAQGNQADAEADKPQHSEPQIHRSPLVERHLAQWQAQKRAAD